ncbi:MAG: hypothetical protein HQK76_09570 [Desulfobacterales bacterium]|nr:hypothetical protein [Desulfobacterales bacterium]
MPKVFRPSTRESKILSKIESSKELARKKAIGSLSKCSNNLSKSIASKLVETGLVETTSQNSLEEEISSCLKELTQADEFNVDYKIAPFRSVVSSPNVVSLYVTAFVLENVINHRDVIDIYGSDDEIYGCINTQVMKHTD